MTPKGIENLKRARTFEDLLNNPDPLEPAKEKLIEDQIAAKSEEARTKKLKIRSGWLTVVDSEAEQQIEKPSDQELLDMIEQRGSGGLSERKTSEKPDDQELLA